MFEQYINSHNYEYCNIKAKNKRNFGWIGWAPDYINVCKVRN